jgi:hypothetical protein
MVALFSTDPQIGDTVTVKARGWFQRLLFGEDPRKGKRGTVTDIRNEPMHCFFTLSLDPFGWSPATPLPLIEVTFEDDGERHFFLPDDLEPE